MDHGDYEEVVGPLAEEDRIRKSRQDGAPDLLMNGREGIGKGFNPVESAIDLLLKLQIQPFSLLRVPVSNRG